LVVVRSALRWLTVNEARPLTPVSGETSLRETTDQATSRRAKRRRAIDRRPAGDSRLVVIDAEMPRTRVELRELWHARELALSFAWRDVKVRYKQSAIGIAWAILQPLLTMVIFTFIFGRFAKFPSQGLPYQVFVYLGLLPWTFFSGALSQISSCVMSNRMLIQKVYFPRLILPLSGILVPAVDFACSILILFGIMLWFGVGIQPTAPLALLFLLMIALTAIGVGSVLATINARFRDVPYAVPFIIQIWLYASPVIYPATALPFRWQLLLSFNPVVAAVGGFRWAVAGTALPSPMQLGIGLGMTCVFLVFGFVVFRRGDVRFADVL
jgi:lipopolysaccharide transport system permease protein